MARETVDILIVGGGLAGLVAAAAFGHAGHSVMLVDPMPLAPDEQDDLRSTAYLQPARQLLEEIGLWPALARHAVALKTLRIVDCTGEPAEIRDQRAFQSDNSASGPLGWNFPNALTRREILSHLQRQPNIELRFGVGFCGIVTRTDLALVSLGDGSRVAARLVIGADGRNSALRQAVGIGVNTTRYGQKALAFTATHPFPHEGISTEIYHHGGPFTMVPLNDVKGSAASAIVWMNAGRRTLELADMPAAQFNAEMTQRSAGLFGPMALAGARSVWPIVTQIATGLIAQRTALIAEAAHVLPPIGAQGLNTSLHDIAVLLAAANAAPDKLGGQEMLETYQSRRMPDIMGRARAIDLFNRVTRSGNIQLQSLRLLGLQAAHDIKPLRRALIRAGMGPA